MSTENRNYSKRSSFRRKWHVRWPAVLACAVLLGGCWICTPAATRSLLSNSLQLASLTGALALPVSACLAYATSRYRVPGYRWVEGCLLVLLFLPLYVHLAAWEAGFGRGGWYSTLIARRLSEPPLEGLRGAVWVHAMALIPWLYWIFRLGLRAIPTVYEEAAALDGSAWSVFRRITLPLVLPIVVGGALFVAIVTMTEITVTDRYQYRSYAEVLYNEYALNPSFEGLPLELASVVGNLSMLVFCGLGFVWFTVGRALPARSASPRPRTIPRASRVVQTSVYLIVFLLIGVPLLNLLYQSGVEVQQVDGARRRAWSIAKCIQLIGTSPWTYRKELAWTTVLAQLSVISSLTIATLWVWWSYRNRWRQFLGMFSAILCFATPGTLIAFAIIRLINPTESSSFMAWIYDNTPLAPWLAMTIKCVPLVGLLLWHGLRSLPTNLLDAARVDGASSSDVLFRVIVPLLKHHLYASALICIAVSSGELSASLLVLPLDAATVSSRIFSLIHYGAEDQLAGLCLSCIAIQGILALLTQHFLVKPIVSSRTTTE